MQTCIISTPKDNIQASNKDAKRVNELKRNGKH